MLPKINTANTFEVVDIVVSGRFLFYIFSGFPTNLETNQPAQPQGLASLRFFSNLETRDSSTVKPVLSDHPFR